MENTAVKQLEQKIRAGRKKRFVEIEKKRETLKKLMQTLGYFQTLLLNSPDLENAEELRSSVLKTIDDISAVLADSEALESRMKREQLNAVVTGAARQGKSQMLRMLSGVADELIPTGDTTFCTAAQSRITNDSTGKIRIHFLSQEQFLEKKVFPYYEGSQSQEGLGLSPRPRTLQEFINSELPRMQEERINAKTAKHYENLENMRSILREKSEILIPCFNGEVREVTPAELKPYITKDDPHATPLYLAVDHVEIHTAFPNSLTEGAVLIDLPGVSEMGPNIREDMKNTIRKDADIVLMMKLPSPNGASWDAYDYELFKMMEEIFPHLSEIKYQDWLAVVVNERTTGNGVNTRQVEALLEQERHGSLPQLIRCDCGSVQTVDEMLEKNLDVLLKKTEKLDDVWCKKFFQDYETAIAETKELYSQLSKASVSIANEFDYKGHARDFKASLRGPVQGHIRQFYDSLREKLAKGLQKSVNEINAAIIQKYDEILRDNKDRSDEIFPIFTVKELEKEFAGQSDWTGILEKAGRQQRWAIITLIRHYVKDIWNEGIMQIYLAEILEKMNEKKAVSMICGTDWETKDNPEEKLRFLQQKLTSQIESGKAKNLNGALEVLLEFKISANGNVLPYFIDSPHFKQLEYDGQDDRTISILSKFIENYKDSQRYEDFAKAVFERLQGLTKLVFSGLNNQEDIVLGNVLQILEANAKMFILQFYFSETVDEEWDFVINTFAREIWPDEFAAAACQSELGRQWHKLLSEIQSLIK